MSVVTEFLVKSGVQHLATAGRDGRPKVRPFQFMREEGGRLYFCTSNEKEVFQEIARQPYVELSACGEGGSWLRLRGKAVFDHDRGVKARIQEASPLVKSIYQDPDNPVFVAFWLEEAHAVIADFSGNPPRHFDL
jgi:uncharacterized pyridoxamine 5'-phosphate oxidase family protein